MPYDFDLSANLKRAGWKVKIQEKERLEPPHVTILRRTDKWRINLRSGEFMDKQPDPSEVPDELTQSIHESWQDICDQWDSKYPSNPVESKEKDDEDAAD